MELLSFTVNLSLLCLKSFKTDILFVFAFIIQIELDSELTPNEQSALCEGYVFFEVFIAGSILPVLFAVTRKWKCPVNSYCLLKS